MTLLLLASAVPAQTGTSSIRGQVMDPKGQAIAGATVTLVNTETNASRNQVSNENGSFAFDLVQPGAYRLEAEATGFKKSIITDVRALVAKISELTITLEVGAISEAVSISAGAGEVLINTQDATIGNNFVSEQITQLPIESRNVVQLLSLQPGVTPGGSVTGSRADQANVTLDGVDVNEQQTGLSTLDGTAFASVLRVTPDSVQEFRVTTTNPNAAQGRSSGAQVSLITKSGTNDFHGSAYEFHRNTITTANNFFNNREGIERPKLIRNVFGGSIGGPIKRERAFFFYAYEGRRDASGETVVRTVPLASLGRGEVVFPNTSGGITTLTADELNTLFPDVGVNPLALAVLADAAAKYQANDDTVGDGLNTGGFRFNAPLKVKLNTHIARFDMTINDKQTLFARGNYQYDLIDRAPQFPDTLSPQFWYHPVGYVVGHTWTMSNTLVNSFHYGLTRLSFSDFGDSTDNDISFRFVFQPKLFTRTLNRVTPVHNITDDVSWLRGAHSFQMGANIRLINNERLTFGKSFDFAIANPSFYDASGAVLSRPISGIAAGFASPVRTAVSAVIGRFSEYAANINFDREGNVLPVGAGVGRNFATQEYDFYFQDSWKFRPDLTFMLGLRYGLSRPVYETNGFQVKPTVPLGDYFEQRKAAASQGRAFNDLITVDLAGPANDREGFYKWDKNNFQPRVAVAWSPSFKGGLLRRLFGEQSGDSVIRGGFSITNDHIGQQLAVQFDLNSTLGFASELHIAANTFNVTTRPAPPFTGFGQDVRALPNITIPSALTFPLVTPADEAQRIESSLDDTLTTPINYSWNASFGRKLPAGFFVEASYIGRLARNLLATRDVMALNNLVDPSTGMDWYTAAGLLADLREQNVPVSRVRPIAYFENLFPDVENFFVDLPSSYSATQKIYSYVARDPVEGSDILDWTFVQALIDDLSSIGPNVFFHPQYAALSTFSTIASSDYHAGTLSVRQRYRDHVYMDFNYTLSKSIDDASGLQTSGAFGEAFILNPLRPQDNRAVSDFDIRHIINANGLWELPIGRGRAFMSNINSVTDAFLGGWQLTGIFRWNSGQPIQTPFDAAQWATNWNVQSNGVRLSPIKSSATKGGRIPPNLFSDPDQAYRTFRNARPGETGDRNVLRLPGYIALDMGLGKSFRITETQRLQFRWEVFNVTNTQRLGVLLGGREGLGLGQDSHLAEEAPPNFGNFTGIQGSPRVMQFGLRYSF
jgi:hypothetical protein